MEPPVLGELGGDVGVVAEAVGIVVVGRGGGEVPSDGGEERGAGRRGVGRWGGEV